MSVEQNIRTFKDFLQFYNLMTQTCFSHCVNTFRRNEVEQDEADCIEKCATKLIRFNNRTIGVYAELQQQLMEKRFADAEKDAKDALDTAAKATAITIENNTELDQAQVGIATEAEGTITKAKD